LTTLAREGAVEQVPGDTQYRLGPRLATLASGLAPVRSLTAIAHPVLVELATATGEAAGLSVPEGDLVRYIHQVDTPNPVSVRDWTGARVPLHAVSSGQVLLAFRPPAALDRYLEHPLERFTPRTITDPGLLRERLREVVRDGYAWVREEFDEGISSVAAPIADSAGEVIAAVHLHGPSYRFPAAGSEATVADLVVGAAADVSGSLRRTG
jgi:DNA-binding IclR family transcriptional regulator